MFNGLNRTTNIIFQCAIKLSTCLQLDYIMFTTICQELFKTFFEDFKRSLLVCNLFMSLLYLYNIILFSSCQLLFNIFSINFSIYFLINIDKFF